MILDLHIENFAIIDELRLRLGPGLNVLTGETGAGKSIVIDAVEVALGGRASSDYVRHGAERALVELTFTDLAAPVPQALEDMGIPGDELVISREVLASGRSAARLNGRSATVQMLKGAASYLIDLHGQHEHQSLLNPERHMDLLDEFGGEGILPLRHMVSQGFREVTHLKSRLGSLGTSERERAQRLDILEYQVNEINGAGLSEDEEEELLARRRVLANAERLFELCSGSFSLLHEGQGPSCQELAGRALSLLDDASGLDPCLKEPAEDLRQVSALLQDVAGWLRRYVDAIELETGTLSEVEERLDLIARLKRKYGGNMREVLEFRDRSSREIDEMRSSEETVRSLQGQLEGAENTLVEHARELSLLRRQAAKDLEKRVTQELQGLGMPRVNLVVEFRTKEACDSRGLDDVEFMLSTNPGEPPRPLGKVASGGEMSRIMLGIKVALAEVDDIPTLIFDEVDSGIGGRAAVTVGRKLEALATRRQVICVTHLAPIASCAWDHFGVTKVLQGERTVARVDKLEGNDRLEEIARMLGGVVSETTLRHARELVSRTG